MTNPLTRRAALAGALPAVAALTVPAAAGAAILADASHPDAALLALGREFEALWERENAVFLSAAEDIAEKACDATGAIVRAIRDTGAETLDGLRVKARAYLWCYAGDLEEVFQEAEEVTTDDQLILSMMRDLLAQELADAQGATRDAAAGAPSLVDASHPDAALFALESRLQAQLDAWHAVLHEQSRAEVVFFAEQQPPHPITGPNDVFEGAEVSRLKRLADAANERAQAAGNEFHTILDELADTPARTLAGLSFKVRWADHEDETEMRDAIYRDLLSMAAAERPA